MINLGHNTISFTTKELPDGTIWLDPISFRSKTRGFDTMLCASGFGSSLDQAIDNLIHRNKHLENYSE